MDKVDITITATVRPKLFQKTLSSFVSNMLLNESDYRIILNVDPIGEDKDPMQIVNVAKGFFRNIVYRVPPNPSFPQAVIWCWQQVTADYCFHLEDDWKLMRPININNMIEILDNDPRLVSLRLSKLGKPETISSKDQNGYIYYPKLSLNPTLLKGSFVKTVVKFMDENLNPEKQLRCGKATQRNIYLCKFLHGVYTKEGLDQIVKDTGRSWMETTKFEKDIGFVHWREKKSESSNT